MRGPLVVIATHPVQYHAPVYREVQRLGLPVTVVYGSDFSVAGYRDAEFGTTFAWDTDLLSGYTPVFLAREGGGDGAPEALRAGGLRAAVEKACPAAILLTGYGLRFHRAAWRAARQTGCPLLLRGETTDHAVVRSPWKAAARDAWLRRQYAVLGGALYIGHRSQQHYERLGVPRERMTFSPYCVDVRPFRPSERDRAALRGPTRAALRIPEGRVVLLYSGKLSERKGVDLVPEAVAQLPADVRERITVLWLGDGALRGPLEARAEALGLDVRFVGFQPQRALSPYYHAGDALVLPSRRGETWGLVVNEALHHGLPCVTTEQVGSVPDLVVPGETGEVVSADSAPALAYGLSRGLAWWRDDPAVRARCRAQVEPYSVEAAARGVVSAFESALSSQWSTQRALA